MPHTCPECQKSFKTASSLASHCKAKRHRLPATSVPPPRAAPPVTKANSAQDVQCAPLNKSFGVHCTRCPVWVADRDGLIQHWEKRHVSEGKTTGVFSFSPSSTARIDPGQGERHATLKEPPAARESSNLRAKSSIATQPLAATAVQLDTLRRFNPYTAQNFKKQTEDPNAGKRCPVCTVVFENRSQHYSEAHPHLKCDDCDRVFESSDEFERHVRDTPDHNSCTLCSVSFKSQETLECHIVRCHAGEPSPAECLVCRKEYRSVDVLSEHIKAVHQAGNAGVVRTVNGVVQYCLASGPSAPRSKPGAASVVSPQGCTADAVGTDRPAAPTWEESEAGRPEVHSTPDTSEAASPPPIVTASVPSVVKAGAAPDGAQGKSGPTRGEDASHTEGSPAAPSGRERRSSLVASDGDSWSEVDGVSEADFVSVDGDSASGGGPGSELASEGLGETDACSDSGVDGCEGASSVAASGGLVCEPSIAPSNDTSQPEAQALNTAEEPARTSPSAPALVCKVCSNAPASPMVTMCGHIFCRGCIIAEISENFCCPACRHPILVEIKM